MIQRPFDGYEFPVYTTESRPRNLTEWQERSSILNCTKRNTYMCVPDDKHHGTLRVLLQSASNTVNEWYKKYFRNIIHNLYVTIKQRFQQAYLKISRKSNLINII